MKRLSALILLLLLSGAVQARISVGDAAPQRLGKNADTAEEILLPDSAGKITVVHFWATWCDYCFRTLPAMEFMQEKLGPDNLRVVSIAVKDEARAVRKITAEMKELSMLSSIDRTGKIAESFGDDYMPNIWVIDRDGKVMAQMPVKSDEDMVKAVKLVEAAIRAK